MILDQAFVGLMRLIAVSITDEQYNCFAFGTELSIYQVTAEEKQKQLRDRKRNA